MTLVPSLSQQGSSASRLDDMVTLAQQKTGELLCFPPRLVDTKIELSYRGVGHEGAVTNFTEVIELPGTLDHIAPQTVDQVLRLLSLAASLSYFKAFAPGEIHVADGLTERERTFLDELTTNGLSEFAYVNDMPAVFRTVVTGPSLLEPPARSGDHMAPRRVLVAVGGGKDSIVSIEALKTAGYDVGLFSVNSYKPIEETAVAAGIPLQSARRQLDSELFRLNSEGAPNGHVPVTAVNSLVAVLTAMALDYDTVAFSNEASSSFGNVVWHGRIINHQWSKSIHFERLLRRSLPADAPTYVSLLRPLTELRIARRFAKLREYHQVFTSCNRAFKLQESERTSWCADCSKCRFVFLCLAPFMPRRDLLAIFGGRDMFADLTQAEGFLELLGADGRIKPLECVGEPDECRVALSLLQSHQDWQNHPFVNAPDVAILAAPLAEHESIFAFHENEHCLSPDLEAVAREI